ncbi:hypothetical protein BC833DRAFT_598281, partial [Globomyces pollinis-pini]
VPFGIYIQTNGNRILNDDVHFNANGHVLLYQNDDNENSNSNLAFMLCFSDKHCWY